MSQNLDQKIASMTERELRELIRKVLHDELAPLHGRFYSPEELVTRNEFQAFIKLLDERHQALVQLMNQRFEAVLAEMNQRFETQDQRFEAQNQRFETILTEMNQRFEAQNQRFEALQREMNQQFKALQREMNQRFEAQNQRFEALQRSIDRSFKWTSLLITMFAFMLSILAILLRFSLP